MKQTAMQEAIKEIADLWSSPSDVPTYSKIIEILESKKQTEKQQLISFGYTQIQNIEAEMGDLIYKKVPEEIYTETYENSNRMVSE